MKALTLPGWPPAGTKETSPATRFTSPTSLCACAAMLAAMSAVSIKMRMVSPLPFPASILRFGLVDAGDLVDADGLRAALYRLRLDLAEAHAFARGLDRRFGRGDDDLQFLGDAFQPRCCI